MSVRGESLCPMLVQDTRILSGIRSLLVAWIGVLETGGEKKICWNANVQREKGLKDSP